MFNVTYKKLLLKTTKKAGLLCIANQDPLRLTTTGVMNRGYYRSPGFKIGKRFNLQSYNRLATNKKSVIKYIKYIYVV